MNAITLLKADHRAVEELFDRARALHGRARGKKTLVEKIVRELSIHAEIEEMIFYPAVREVIPDATAQVLEALEEHNVVKWSCDALLSMGPEDERYDAKVKVLMDEVLHHVEEEENELFPRVREAMSTAQLNDLGRRLEQAKKIAPTRPHPRAPDVPPGNFVAGVGAGVVDRTRDAARTMMRKGQRAAARAGSSVRAKVRRSPAP